MSTRTTLWTPQPARRPLRQSEGASSCFNRFPPDLATGGKPNALVIHVPGVLELAGGRNVAGYPYRVRVSGDSRRSPGARRALKVSGFLSPGKLAGGEQGAGPRRRGVAVGVLSLRAPAEQLQISGGP
jgi:hypothetical protein